MRRARKKSRPVARKRVAKKRSSTRRNPARRVNPHMQGAILMGAIKEIVYANRYSATPSKLYVHKFGAGVGVYALRDGTIAIRGKRRLWDTFSVGDSE